MILIISICKEKLHESEFVKPIVDIVKKFDKVKIVNCQNLKIKDINDTDKIIITGTSLKDNDFLMHLDKFSWIKTTNKKVLGICGGAHIIGLLQGKKLKKKKEIGLKDLVLKIEFLGMKGKLQVYHLHQFYVLPETYHKGNIYATLFHPEVRNKILIENFVKL
jgi:GMP synthase-like glutamine amidotransferase